MDDEVMSLKQQVQALTAKLAKDSETKKKLRTHVHLLKEKAINLGILVTELQSVKQDKAGLQQECERLTAALAGEQQRVQEAVQREQLTAQQKLHKEQQFFDLAREKQQLQSSWAAHERELQQLQKQLHAAVQEGEAEKQQRQAVEQEKQAVLSKLEQLQQQWHCEWQLMQSAIQQLQQQQQQSSTSNTRLKAPEQPGQGQQQQQQIQQVSQIGQPPRLIQQEQGMHMHHAAIQEKLQHLEAELQQLRQCQQHQQHQQRQVMLHEQQLQQVKLQLHELQQHQQASEQQQQQQQQQQHLPEQVRQLHSELQQLRERGDQQQPSSQQQFVDLQQEVQQLRAQVCQQRQQIGQLQQQCSQVTREYSRWRHCLGAMIQPEHAFASLPGSHEPASSPGLTPVVASAGGTREPSPAAAGAVPAAAGAIAAATAHAAAIGRAVAAVATARAGNCSAAVSRAGQEVAEPAGAAGAALPLRVGPFLAGEQPRRGLCMFGTTTLAIGGSSSSYSGQNADAGDTPAVLPLLRQSSSPTVAGRLQLRQHCLHQQRPHQWQQQPQVTSPSQSPAGDLSTADGNLPRSSAGSGDDDDVREPAWKRQRSAVTPPAEAAAVTAQQQQQQQQETASGPQLLPGSPLQPEGNKVEKRQTAGQLMTVQQPQQHVLPSAARPSAAAAADSLGAAAGGMLMCDVLTHLQAVKAGRAQPAAAARCIAEAVADGHLPQSLLVSAMCSSFLEGARSKGACYCAPQLQELLSQAGATGVSAAPRVQQEQQHWQLVSLMAYAGWSEMPLAAAAAASRHLAELAVQLEALLPTEQGQHHHHHHHQQQQQQQQQPALEQQLARDAGLDRGGSWEFFGQKGVPPWSEVLMGCWHQHEQQSQDTWGFASRSSSCHLIGSLIQQLMVPVWPALAAAGAHNPQGTPQQQQQQQQQESAVPLACAACSAVASLCCAANDVKGFQGFVVRLLDTIAGGFSSSYCQTNGNVCSGGQNTAGDLSAASSTVATAGIAPAAAAAAAVGAAGAMHEAIVAAPADADMSKLLALACLVAAVASWPQALLLDPHQLQQCIKESGRSHPAQAPPPADPAATDREVWLWQCAVSQPVLLALQAALAGVAQAALVATEQLPAGWGSCSSFDNSAGADDVACDDVLTRSASRLGPSRTCARALMFTMKQMTLAQQAAQAKQHDGRQQQQQLEAGNVCGAFECSAPTLEQLVPMLLGLLQQLLHQRWQQQQRGQAGPGRKMGADVSQAERAMAAALCAALKMATAALPKAAVQQLLCSPLKDILQTTAGPAAAPGGRQAAASEVAVPSFVPAASAVTGAADTAADCAGNRGSAGMNKHVKSVVKQLQQVVGDASCNAAGDGHI